MNLTTWITTEAMVAVSETLLGEQPGLLDASPLTAALGPEPEHEPVE